jgi:hypothetical protein
MEIQGIVGEGKTRAMLPDDIEIAVMGKEGDVKTIWNPKNADEVENARKTFNDMKKKGYLAFKVAKDGEKGEQMTEFDPDAAKMILMVPAFQGG